MDPSRFVQVLFGSFCLDNEDENDENDDNDVEAGRLKAISDLKKSFRTFLRAEILARDAAETARRIRLGMPTRGDRGEGAKKHASARSSK